MTLKVILKLYFWRENVRVFAICMRMKASFHVSRQSVNQLWFIDFSGGLPILLHGVISLPNATS